MGFFFSLRFWVNNEIVSIRVVLTIISKQTKQCRLHCYPSRVRVSRASVACESPKKLSLIKGWTEGPIDRQADSKWKSHVQVTKRLQNTLSVKIKGTEKICTYMVRCENSDPVATTRRPHKHRKMKLERNWHFLEQKFLITWKLVFVLIFISLSIYLSV